MSTTFSSARPTPGSRCRRRWVSIALGVIRFVSVGVSFTLWRLFLAHFASELLFLGMLDVVSLAVSVAPLVLSLALRIAGIAPYAFMYTFLFLTNIGIMLVGTYVMRLFIPHIDLTSCTLLFYFAVFPILASCWFYQKNYFLGDPYFTCLAHCRPNVERHRQQLLEREGLSFSALRDVESGVFPVADVSWGRATLVMLRSRLRRRSARQEYPA